MGKRNLGKYSFQDFLPGRELGICAGAATTACRRHWLVPAAALGLWDWQPHAAESNARGLLCFWPAFGCLPRATWDFVEAVCVGLFSYPEVVARCLAVIA
jgi:hypothetical protein